MTNLVNSSLCLGPRPEARPGVPGGQCHGPGWAQWHWVAQRAWKKHFDCLEEFLGNHQATQEWCSTHIVYRVGGALLASTEDIVGQWKEYIEELFNPTDMSSVVEAESGDEKDDLTISGDEVTVKQLLGGRVPGVDDVYPELLKALDVIGLSWLTQLYNVAWR